MIIKSLINIITNFVIIKDPECSNYQDSKRHWCDRVFNLTNSSILTRNMFFFIFNIIFTILGPLIIIFNNFKIINKYYFYLISLFNLKK